MFKTLCLVVTLAACSNAFAVAGAAKNSSLARMSNKKVIRVSDEQTQDDCLKQHADLNEEDAADACEAAAETSVNEEDAADAVEIAE